MNRLTMTPGWMRSPARLTRGACSAALAAVLLSGCAHDLPQGGPSTAEIVKSSTANPKKPHADYVLITLDGHVAAALPRPGDPSLLASFGDMPEDSESRIKPGDYVTVTFWEAGSVSPLLGAGGSTEPTGGATPSTPHEVVPEQIVGEADGAIQIPYAGRVRVAGMSIVEADKAIRASLHGLASDPQVLLTITRNTSNQAVVVGDDIKGLSFTLTPNADRVLDAVAAAGGVGSPVYQAQVRLTRNGRHVTMGLARLLDTPDENIHLHPQDVLQVLKNPKFFTLLGAVGKDAQVQFQNDRMTLAEALGNGSGLLDERADPSGVFLFRFEPKARVQQLCPTCNIAGLGDVIKVVYRLNMRHADAFFVAQQVLMADRDVLFVSNAPEVQTAKIFAVVRDAFQPVIAAGVIARDAQN